MRELTVAREQSCDAVAANVEGRVHVAKALTIVARLGMGHPAVGMSMGGSCLEERVLFLLEQPQPTRWWPIVPTLCVLAVVGSGAGPLHNTIERIAALLLH